MGKKMKSILLTSLFVLSSILFLSSCSKSNNAEKETVISKDSSVSDEFSNTSTNENTKEDEKTDENKSTDDGKDADDVVFEVLDSEVSDYGAAYQISESTSDVLGNSYAQISYVSEDEISLRYVFELKTLDCDVSLTYKIYNSDKTTIYMGEKTQAVDTVYTGYYSDNTLVTKDNTWYVVFTMRGIPTDCWDYYISVDCNVYTSNTETVIGNSLANKNALTILYLDGSSYLDSDYTFNYSDGEYELTGYNGSDTELTLPSKELYYDSSKEECVYVAVTTIKASSLTSQTKIIIPTSYEVIESGSVSSSAILLYEGTSLDTLTNNTSNTVYIYSDLYSQAAWHYKNDVARLWSESISIESAYGYNETATVTFNCATDAEKTDFNVYYSTDKSTYTQIDNELILIDSTSGLATAYLVGLAQGSYYIKVELADDTTEYKVSNRVEVSSQDRSGYAHFNYTSGVGAYNDDGTLKDDTVVVYVTDDTKNTVQATINGTIYTGLVSILKAQKNSSYPLVVRVLDEIQTTQWDYVDTEATFGNGSTDERKFALASYYYNSENDSSWDTTKSSSYYRLYESEMKSLGLNSMSNDLASGITELDGLSSYISYSFKSTSSSYQELDSYFNMADISNVSNVTIEGIGTNAGMYQWGFTFSNSNSIEVKNLKFRSYPEDAIGIQGGSNSDMDYANFWIHNCTFDEGINNLDVTYENDKTDGDGSTDFKYAHNLTISYCVYNETHKTNLIGSSNDALQYNVSLHHNYYNSCKARLPLIRQANAHIYNNYYFDTTSTGISTRAKSFVFAEGNYFDGKNPLMLAYEVKNSVDPVGTTIKAINNTYTSNVTLSDSSSGGLAIGADGIYVLTASGSNKAYSSNTSATRTTSSSGSICSPDGLTDYTNFDTNESLFYYDSTKSKSNVTILNDSNDVPDVVLSHAGSGNNYYSSLEIGTSTDAEISNLDLNFYTMSGSNGTYHTDYVKTIYKEGEALDTSYLTLLVDDVYQSDISDCLFTGYSSTAGTYTITVDYLNLSTEYTVYVLPDSSYYYVAVGSNYTVGGTTVLDGNTYITFNTIEQALEYLRNFVTTSQEKRATLYISQGQYYEKLEIDVPYLTIKGAGTVNATYEGDEQYNATDFNYATIIEWDSLYGVYEQGLTNSTNSTQTVSVRSSAVGLVIENLTISNWWNNDTRFNNMYDYLSSVYYYDSSKGTNVYLASNNKVTEHRALALLVEADQFIMNNCSLLGYQDTLELLGNRQYFYNSYISGTTDYIFGTNNSTLFDNCTIHTIY
ncbi:MAG: hypothetical protein K6E20_04555, partial [Acholeplasmatales bacterium]|nr:hypothetical protein [Acholeplasmatales bacterium]